MQVGTNVFVESVNGRPQQDMRAARGHRTAMNFIAIAHPRLSGLKQLRLTRSLRVQWSDGVLVRLARRVPLETACSQLASHRGMMAAPRGG